MASYVYRARIKTLRGFILKSERCGNAQDGEIPVCPLLLDLSAGDLKAPLAYFQAREFTEAGLRSLCAEIAKKARMDEAQFRRNFSVVWSQIASALRKKRKRKGNRRLSKVLNSVHTSESGAHDN